MDGFSSVIQYYLKISRVDEALAFFDREIGSVIYGKSKVSQEKRRELREAIVSHAPNRERK